MDDPNALDAAVLGPYLEAEVPGFSGLRAIEKFTAGQSNPTYLLDCRKRALCAARQAAGPAAQIGAPGRPRIPRHEGARAARRCRCRTMLHLSAEDSPIGRMFYVMAFVEGRIFWDPALPEIADNAGRAAIYDAMNETLADLHGVDVAAAGLADFGRPGSYFERQLARWTSQYRASETETVADMDRLIAWLESQHAAGRRRWSRWSMATTGWTI